MNTVTLATLPSADHSTGLRTVAGIMSEAARDAGVRLGDWLPQAEACFTDATRRRIFAAEAARLDAT